MDAPLKILPNLEWLNGLIFTDPYKSFPYLFWGVYFMLASITSLSVYHFYRFKIHISLFLNTYMYIEYYNKEKTEPLE